MRNKFTEFVMSVMGVKEVNIKELSLEDVLHGRNLEEQIQELDLTTLKALFRYSGKELRKRL
jgi:hypothetical protein